MRVDSVRAWHLHHPDAVLVEDGTTPPLSPGAKGRRQLAVEVVTDGGERGLAVGYAPPGARAVVHEVLGPALGGRDPGIVGELWAEMMWAVRDFGRGGVALQAVSAVDLALWDLKARTEDLPLFRLLGAVREEVSAYASGGFTSTPIGDLVSEVRGFVADGFGAVKMKVGTAFGTREAEDLARVAAVRDAIGAGVELYVDANGAYGVEQAIHMAERFAAHDVRLFEEPLPPTDVSGLAAIRRETPIPIAAGEHEYEASGLRRLVEAGAVDVLQPDLLRVGGISGWLQAAAVAAEHDIPILSHAAQLASLHAGCATSGSLATEYLAIQADMDRRWYAEVPEPSAGRWAPFADRPGLGLELRPERRPPPA